MRAWFALTHGRYREMIAAAHAGQDAGPGRSVSVQLLAHEAKAWARMGNQRNVLQALEKGRVLLDALPYPERPDNHFVVDPDKFDVYATDCYRMIGDGDLAEIHPREIIRKTTHVDGSLSSPMRAAEARLALAVVAACRGDVEHALTLGEQAIAVDRRSQPSLLLVGRELDEILRERYATRADVAEFHRQLAAIAGGHVA